MPSPPIGGLPVDLVADAAMKLDMAEAVELGHAWCQQLARRNRIRALLIKGPTLERYGLRTPRVSGDIDVLIEPDRFDEAVAAVRAAGWGERPASYLIRRTTLHSRTFTHHDWPCDLDLHRSFPGFLVDAATLFEALWTRRNQMTFAHHECAVPDRLSSVLILALHSERGTSEQPRHQQELKELLSLAQLSDDERCELAMLAQATGSAATLHHVLSRLGVDTAVTDAELRSPDVARWRTRVESGSSGAYFWFDLLGAATTLGDAITILSHAAWPSDTDLLLMHPDIPDRAWPRLVARIRRVCRAVPAAAQAIMQRRAGEPHRTRATAISHARRNRAENAATSPR